MDPINIHSAKTQLSKLIEAAERGEEVIIARAGKPVAKLVALENQKPARKAGSMKGLFEVPESFFEPLPEDLLDAFEGKA
jgi:prevent-host-death family protein